MKCVICNTEDAGKYYGAGDGTGAKFQCPECHWRSKYELAIALNRALQRQVQELQDNIERAKIALGCDE